MIYDTASTGSMHAIAAARQAADPESRTSGAAPRPGGLHLRAGALFHREGRHRASASARTTCARCRWTPSSACGPDALAELIERDLAARPAALLRGRHRRHHFHHQRGPGAGHRRHLPSGTASGCTWMRPTPARPPSRPSSAGRSRAATAPIRWSPIPHKWLLTPMDCSVFYTRRPEVLRRAFSLIPEYLRDRRRSARRQPDGLRRAARPPLPRPQAVVRDALLRPRGPGRDDPRPRRHGAGIRAPGWMPTRGSSAPRPRRFSVVCFRYKGTDDENRRILDGVNAHRREFPLRHRMLNGRYTLHLAIGNHGHHAIPPRSRLDPAQARRGPRRIE